MKKMESTAIIKSKKLSADRLCYLFLVFLAGCLVGWIYEEIFYWITPGCPSTASALWAFMP